MITLSLTDDLPSLLVPCRMDVFGEVTIRKRKKLVKVPGGWHGWNDDPAMEQQMARLRGSGSFYWPNALKLFIAAKRMMTQDPTIHQIKLETISGREIGRLRRKESSS